MRRALALLAMAAVSLLFASAPLLASDPSLEVSQYAHTSWTVRDGFSLGARLRDGPDTRRVPVARERVRFVSLRRRELRPVAASRR